MSTQERDGIPEWTPKIGIQCAILDLRENAIRLRDGSYSPQTIADDLEVIVNDLSKCFPVAQQEQPESWTRHPNPVHHIGPLSEEHLRDVVERTKAMQVALDAWVAQAQSGQTEVPCPLAFVEQTASVDAYVGAREDAAIWKKRALEAEELNRKFIAELNGPTYLGEPAQQEQPSQEPVAFITTLMEQQMFDDWCPYKGSPDPRVVWAAAIDAANGLLLQPPTQPALRDEMVKQSKMLDSYNDRNIFIDGWLKCEEAHCRGGAQTQTALSDSQLNVIFNMTAGYGRDDYISFARAIEAQCRNGTPLYTEAQMRQLASSVADVCDPEGIWADEYIELIKEILG